MNIAHITPVLADEVDFYPFDSSTYLLQQTAFSHQLRINTSTYKLLKLIDGQRNIETIAKLHNADNAKKVSVQDVHKILYEKLAQWGIVQHDIPVLERQKDGYLLLRFTLISEKLLLKITPFLGFLFNQKRFFSILFLLALFALSNLYVLVFINNFQYAISPETAFGLYAVVGIIVLLHELGHATACRKFGAKHGGIGFGFYLFMPVCYADVTDAWKLPKKQRIIIDFAGIFMDLITLNMALLAFYIFKIPILAYMAILVGFNILMNLNPFFRFDGYWALADFTGIPNLRTDAMNAVKNSFFFKNTNQNLVKNIFLLAYGLTSWGFLLAFLGFVGFYQTSSLWLFPVRFFEFLKTCLTEPANMNISYLQANIGAVVIPILFYFTLWNLLKNRVMTLNDFFTKTIK